MFDNLLFRFVAVLIAVTLLVATASATTITHGTTTIDMDFVTVGNPGNAADDTTYGRVEYSYNIGKYEVRQDQWDAVVAADTNYLLDDPGCWSGAQPVAEISWNDAAMFCNWLTSGDVTAGAYTIDSGGVVTVIDRGTAVGTYGTVYVIPTENEWYKAAYYDGGTSTYYDYPTGSDAVPDGLDSTEDNSFEAVFDEGYSQGYPNDVNNAGALSAYGTMGQGGNVWEWNETAIGSWRGKRGGSWLNGSNILIASQRNDADPAREGNYLGFRVASIPEPGSISLLLCGLAAGLVYWRRKR